MCRRWHASPILNAMVRYSKCRSRAVKRFADASVLMQWIHGQLQVPLTVSGYMTLGRKVCVGSATRCDGALQRMQKSCSQALRDASVLMQMSQRQVHMHSNVFVYTTLGRGSFVAAAPPDVELTCAPMHAEVVQSSSSRRPPC